MMTPERIRELIGDPDREMGERQRRDLKNRMTGRLCFYCGDVPAMRDSVACRDCSEDLT